MIEDLLPGTAVVVEAFGEEGVREFGDAPLYPQEEALLTRAVAKRRREFTVVRGCARRAMEKLGVPPQPVLPGERGAPQWPDGLTGSMTHCEGYCAAALVRAEDLASLGIDAEPHAPLPEGVLAAVALPAEAARHERLAAERPEVHWDRLLFSAKESVYKAWFPLTRKWLDFSEADIDLTAAAAGPDAGAQGTFRARLLVPGPLVGGRRVGHFEGLWSVRRGLVATAVTVGHD
ncbi:4'-phosphopantetheinyl transferase superfamily protein [Streptomyces sp. IBSBF 2953]|uniref:4'-phosphopantetheinyl transferase family protein n=2 Tax=Streptomyces TaxID=1883 RepID=UPI002119E016|nr:4'-phosphopantetheinyl transferase superfamily protein [Streptomyces scabiei]MCQ9185438.1 4'-phosphopantetheinyl transferase superfamily protein [Streptomyces hayashii]MDX3118271.1 4'-phosphopantetheinyl transferase superfamily protein [Streptomyces scabiei]